MAHGNHVFEKGAANGIATLDAGVQVPLTQLRGSAGTLDNLAGITSPGVGDDSDAGYAVGSLLIDVVASPRMVWRCVDASVGAAIWRRLDNPGRAAQLASFSTLTDKSSTFLAIGAFIFAGTLANGTPTQILVVGGVDGATEAEIRIQDVTNGLTIASTTTTASFPAIIDLGVISNLPTGNAIWEIQARRSNGSGNQTVSTGSATIEF